MKNIIIFTILLTLISCTNDSTDQQQEQSKAVKPIIVYENTRSGISVFTINDCQYVYAETPHGLSIIHAANCSNPFHNRK